MKQEGIADVAVVGGGIVGLAHALAAAKRGHKVVLLERNTRAVGASIRNFGLIWPIGQPTGELFQRALRSRAIWLEIAQQAGIWCVENGSLHLAYHPDECAVIEEYYATTPEAHDYCQLLAPHAVANISPAARTEGLQLALWSKTELNVDPRQAIYRLPQWLVEAYGVECHFGVPVTAISPPYIETPRTTWRANHIFVCTGADYEILYPTHYDQSGIIRCKLQMLRTAPQPNGWQLGPSLCAGLTLLHYRAFAHCQSLSALRERIKAEMPFYIDEHIHVLLSQTALGELTIGDHHEYGNNPDPFDRETVNEAILSYLKTFARAPHWQIAERWHGIYPLIKGQSELILHPEDGVTIVNALGGAGMTLSFGLAEEIMKEIGI